jgi:hypothetical protein
LLTMLCIPFLAPLLFFNAHDSQVWSSDGVSEFFYFLFTGLELLN